MIKKTLTSIVFIFIFVFSCLSTYGQDTQKPQLFFVEDFVLKPSEIENFQETIKQFLNLFEEHNFKYPVNSYITSDFHMYFTFPLQGMSDVEKIFAEVDVLAEKVGIPKWSELHDAEFQATESYQFGLYYLRPDLSYIPENPRLSPEESVFLEWEFMYIKPGMDMKAEEIWKEWVELYKKKGITDPYYCWVGFIGPELPLYIFTFFGKDHVDIHEANAAIVEKIGDEGDALYEKTMNLIKKTEHKSGNVLQDLTYTPEKD